MSRAMTPWSPTVGTVWYSIWAFLRMLSIYLHIWMKSLGVGPSGPQNLTRSPRCPTLHPQLQGFSMVFCCVRAQCMCAWHEEAPAPDKEKNNSLAGPFGAFGMWVKRKNQLRGPNSPRLHLPPTYISLVPECPRCIWDFLRYQISSTGWGFSLLGPLGVVPQNLKSLQSFQHPEPSRTWCHAVVGQAGVFNQRPGLCNLCNNKIGIFVKMKHGPPSF